MQSKLIILRKEKKITQETLADILGISVKQYGYKEVGKSKFDADEMFKIADYFGLSINDIFLPSYHQNGDSETETIEKE